MADTRKRIAMAGTSFRRLDNIWKAMDIHVRRKTKISLFKSLVLSVLLHGCETWKLTKTEEKRIDTFQTKSLKRMSDRQINGQMDSCKAKCLPFFKGGIIISWRLRFYILGIQYKTRESCWDRGTEVQ